MRLTRQQLNSLEDNHEFQRLPASVVLDKNEFGHWETVGGLVRHEAAKATCWVIFHKLAALFEAYPEQLDTIAVSWESGHDDFPLLISSFNINGAHVRYERENRGQGDWIPISRHFQNMRDADGGAALDETMDWLRGISYGDKICHELIKARSTFDLIFKEPIRSAQEARARAREHAPEVEAWVKRNLLEAGLGLAAAPVQSARIEPKL